MDSLLIKDLQAIFCDTVPLMKGGGRSVCEKVYKKAYVGSNINICLMFSTAYAVARCKTQTYWTPSPIPSAAEKCWTIYGLLKKSDPRSHKLEI